MEKFDKEIEKLNKNKDKYYNEIQKNLEINKRIEKMIQNVDQRLDEISQEKSNYAKVPKGSQGSTT